MITRSLELLREMLRKDPAPSVRELGEEAVRMALEEEAQLRADLATVTAELAGTRATLDINLDHYRREIDEGRAAHAETRKALEEATTFRESNLRHIREPGELVDSTRDVLAKAEVRVKAAKAIAGNAFAKALALDAEEILEALDG